LRWGRGRGDSKKDHRRRGFTGRKGFRKPAWGTKTDYWLGVDNSKPTGHGEKNLETSISLEIGGGQAEKGGKKEKMIRLIAWEPFRSSWRFVFSRRVVKKQGLTRREEKHLRRF